MRRIFSGCLMVVAVIAAAGCTGSNSETPQRPRISVAPADALLDEPVRVTISGVPSHSPITVTAAAEDSDGATWSSRAVFRASQSGRVSLNRSPSIGGSYRGVDGMGLFEYMAASANVEHSAAFSPPSDGYDVLLTVRIDGHTVATATTRRKAQGSSAVIATRERLAATGIYGVFFRPERMQERHPAVLVFGGSQGGLRTRLEARTLAAHGYPALALAYFDEPGLPQELARIPLEYFVTALRLLAEQPGVDPRHLLVWGISRGSEAALLLGVHYPDLVHGIIAGDPSSVVNPGFPDPSTPAWTLHGEPIPGVSRSEFNDPTPKGDPRAVIPVEKINGPVLLVCGEQDVVWHSCGFMRAITRRLAAHHFTHRVTALSFPRAGHAIGLMQPYLSVGAGGFGRAGGTTTGNEEALAKAHAGLLRFLAQQ